MTDQPATSPTPDQSGPSGPPLNFGDISLENYASHLLFGEVSEDSMRRACEFILKGNQLFDGSEPLTLFVNSVGGSVTDGFALVDLIQLSGIPVKTIAIGSIMSMGLMIFTAGCKKLRWMTRNTMVMSHQFTTGNYGKFHELAADIKGHLYMKHMFMEHFKRHTKLTEKKIESLMFGPSDAYLTPKECLRYGICDILIDELPEIDVTLPSYKIKTPITLPVPKRRKKNQPAEALEAATDV